MFKPQEPSNKKPTSRIQLGVPEIKDKHFALMKEVQQENNKDNLIAHLMSRMTLLENRVEELELYILNKLN